MWTYSAHELGTGPIRQLGVNFGAPGDRRAPNGTLWLDSPNVGGPSPQVDVVVTGQALNHFRLHPLTVTGEGLNWVAASGMEGVESIRIPVAGAIEAEQEQPARHYTVRLVFCEPGSVDPGARKFDIRMQGNVVAQDFDIAKEAGANRKSLVRAYPGVLATDAIEIAFSPSAGTAVVSGVEVLLEE